MGNEAVVVRLCLPYGCKVVSSFVSFAWDLVVGQFSCCWFVALQCLFLQAAHSWSCSSAFLDFEETLLLVVVAVFVGPKYGFIHFSGNHFGPGGIDTQAYPLPQVINGKDLDIRWVSGSLINTGGFSSTLAQGEFEKCTSIGGVGFKKEQFRKFIK